MKIHVVPNHTHPNIFHSLSSVSTILNFIKGWSITKLDLLYISYLRKTVLKVMKGGICEDVFWGACCSSSTPNSNLSASLETSCCWNWQGIEWEWSLWISWGTDRLVRSLVTTLHSPEVKSECGRFIDAHGKGPRNSLVIKRGPSHPRKIKRILMVGGIFSIPEN